MARIAKLGYCIITVKHLIFIFEGNYTLCFSFDFHSLPLLFPASKITVCHFRGRRGISVLFSGIGKCFCDGIKLKAKITAISWEYHQKPIEWQNVIHSLFTVFTSQICTGNVYNCLQGSPRFILRNSNPVSYVWVRGWPRDTKHVLLLTWDLILGLPVLSSTKTCTQYWLS